ncbi:MAG: glycosyltransferase family 4 protein [Candidatus Thermoplasmatota archaeon]|nr:glycosyltransferase family 4 protein [Candidatus Thermoplasmatota archaeon]
MEPSEVDSPLSVLLVHVWYWPHLGGGNQHVEHIARQLVARGHKATVWCADIPEHEEKRFIRDGVEVIRLPPKRILGGIDPVVSVQQLEMNFDIVHLHDTLPVLIRRSIKRARKEKIPVVTTFHNDYIKTSLSGKILKRIRWALQGRRTLHSSNARIALTPYYANHLKNRGVYKSIDVLPNGFEPVAEDAARPASLPVSFEEHSLFVFVGRLSEQKGLDVLMDAWDMLCHQGEPNACLAIAGSGELDAWLDKRIASSKYPDSIAKLGRVDDAEKRWLFEQAKGVLIPSRFEGLPTVLLEAMHAGAPTVMADVNDLGRLVTEPNAGLSVAPGDAQDLLKAIKTLLQADDDQIKQWSENGHEASKPYLWSNVVDDLLEVYKRVRT